MILVKTYLNDRSAIEVALSHDNTFARCPKCGSSFPIDLVRFLEDTEFDPVDSEIMCEECSREFVRRLEDRKA